MTKNNTTVFAFLIMVIFLIPGLSFDAQTADIITVDGLSFVNTLLLPGPQPINESEHYLKTALDSMNLKPAGTTVMAFPWSRDANDTAKTVEALRIFLKLKYQAARQAGKRFIIVAHSWGTVLTYLALSSQSRQVQEGERVYVDLYVTLGSPLGTEYAHGGNKYLEESTVIAFTHNWTDRYSFCGNCLPLVTRWLNYWAWGDVISGPFDGFMPFSGNLQWLDTKLDPSDVSSGYPARNSGTTVLWHMYDSLQPGGVLDNQPLLDTIKAEIERGGGIEDQPPFGSFDSPYDRKRLRGSAAVTGWALDDYGVAHVKIYRDPVNGENPGPVYIGDATFVEGARPDVETSFPGYPNNSRAGWGYMLLTNFLPDGGNGWVTLTAIATDNASQTTTLGSRAVYCDNKNAVKPFGAIDTPAQGGIASGSEYINWGWVLTPQPNRIPEDGSTIQVWVDGVAVGNPIYNIYRSDIATLFPGYANSQGAVGYFYLDTTAYANGVHTIQWTATDSAGNSDGIGSRYFTIQNPANSQTLSTPDLPPKNAPIPDDLSVHDEEPIRLLRGNSRNNPSEFIQAGESGHYYIETAPMERMEIQLFNRSGLIMGYMDIGGQFRSLPVGSTFDKKKGKFYWQPGPGFRGRYKLIFLEQEANSRLRQKVLIVRIK